MTQREFETYTNDQQLYAVLTAIDPSVTMTQQYFQRLTLGQQLYQIVIALDPSFGPSEREFNAWSVSQQLYALMVAAGGGGGPLPGPSLLLALGSADGSLTRDGWGAFSGLGDLVPWQREVGPNFKRDHNYLNGAGDESLLLEVVPTQIALVAPSNLVATPLVNTADYSWDPIPVTVNLLRYDYRTDAGTWIDNGTLTTVSGVSIDGAPHTFSVRAVSDSGAIGAVATSGSFAIPTPTWFDAIDIASCDSGDSSGGSVSIGQRVTVGATGSCTRVRVGQNNQITTAAIKVAVYSLDGLTLLGQGSVASQGPATGAWGEVLIDVPFPVTSGTEYRVAFSLSNVAWGFPGYLASGGGVSLDFTNTYGSFPPATWTEPEFSPRTHAVGMGVV